MRVNLELPGQFRKVKIKSDRSDPFSQAGALVLLGRSLFGSSHRKDNLCVLQEHYAKINLALVQKLIGRPEAPQRQLGVGVWSISTSHLGMRDVDVQPWMRESSHVPARNQADCIPSRGIKNLECK